MAEPVVFGRYLLLERIAAGGMAEVYKSKSYGVAGFEKLLVIKKILPHLSQNERFVSMFIKEAKIAVNLNHKNVVQVFDLGKVADDYYIAMEFVHGKDLREITRACAKKRIPLPLSLACYLLAEIAAGLDYAHRRKDLEDRPLNIIHMDISPQNVLVSFEGDVKIADFGIAHAVGGEGKMKGGVLRGKYAYMSPEMATGKPVDQRTDIFSAGVILHELITGRRLFYEPDEVKTIENVRKCSVPPPSTINPQVPPKLEQVTMKALAADPDRRYRSAEELRADLTEVLFGFTRVVDAADLSRFLRKVFAKEAAPAPGVSDLANLISDLSRLGARPPAPIGPGTASGTARMTPARPADTRATTVARPERTVPSIEKPVGAIAPYGGTASRSMPTSMAMGLDPTGERRTDGERSPVIPASALEFDGDSQAYDGRGEESVPAQGAIPDDMEGTESSAIPLAGDELVARGEVPAQRGRARGGSPPGPAREPTVSRPTGREGFDWTLHAGSGAQEISISGERKRAALVAVRFFEAGRPARPNDARAGETAQLVKRFGGTPTPAKGDLLLAYFGVPLAGEDDLERALSFALAALREERHAAARTGGARAVALAVHTGTVAVESSGNPRIGPLVSGAPLSLVERLARSAAAGRIVASRSVVRAAYRRNDFVRIDPDVDRETGTTTERHELLEAARRTGEALAGDTAPLIGRARELTILTGVFAKIQRGHGQVLALVGEAGSGKSRLVRELSRLTANKELALFVARASPFGADGDFALIGDLIASIVGFSAEDSLEERREKLMRLTELGLEKHEVHFVGELSATRFDASGIEAFDPQARRLGMFAALRKVVERLAKERPLLLVFEDLQHADPMARDALEFLLDAVPERRLLVMLTYRPEFKHRWWDRAWYNQIVLKPLSVTESLDMARACFAAEFARRPGAEAVPAESIVLPKRLGKVILDTAGGNPMFMEELCGALVRGGKVLLAPNGAIHLGGEVQRLEVPPTLRATVSARIDRLHPDLKRLLQVASVLGRRFPYRALIDLAGMGERADGLLVELQRAGFLVESPDAAGELTYAFRHPMMREVAYHALPTTARRRLHRSVADHLVRNSPEGQVPVEALALHYEQAQDVERAVTHLGLAGDKQVGEYRDGDALSYFRRARDLLDGQPELDRSQRVELSDLELKIGRCAARLGWMREAESALTRADELARAVGDSARRAWALKELGELLRGDGALDRAAEALREAVAIVEREEDPRLRFEVLEAQGNLLAWTGRPEQAERELKRALAEAKKLKDLSMVARILTDLGALQRRAGAYDLSREYLLRAEEGARRAEDRFLLSRVMIMVGTVAVARGEQSFAEAKFREALELSRAIGDQRGAATALHNLGALHARLNDPPKARYYLTEADAISQEIGWKAGEMANRVYLAWLRAVDGNPRDGRAELESAVGESVKHGSREAVARGKFFLGRLLADAGDRKRGRALLAEARLLAEEIGNRQLVAEIDSL